MIENIKIYTLTDPLTGLVAYVGKTSASVHLRLVQHLAKADLSINAGDKSKWLISLKEYGLSPIITVLEHCNDSNWKEREIHWISVYKNINPNLLNKTIGGEDSVFLKGNVPWNKGGGDYSDETRMKMRLGKLGKTLSNETKSNMSAASLGKSKSDSHKMNIRLGQGKKVIQMDLDGNYIQEFPAASFAAESVGCVRESIRDACTGRMKSCKGFKWKFKEQIIND